MSLSDDLHQAIQNLEFLRCKLFLHASGAEPLRCAAQTDDAARDCVLAFDHAGDHVDASGRTWPAGSCLGCGAPLGQPCRGTRYFAFGNCSNPHDREKMAQRALVASDMHQRVLARSVGSAYVGETANGT